jgi:hypothetical protein
MAKRKAAAARTRSTRTSAARKGSRKSAARKAGRRTATARKARKTAARKTARKCGRKPAAKTTVRAAGRKRSAAKTARKAKTTSVRRSTSSKTVVARKAPALNRARRTAPDDDLVPTPPSSLDLDRSASAVRTGRRELRERYAEHTETSPALTAGDVDADWESAYSVGDEAPGGDNPTPDQDIVDDIGRAVGNEYQDTEELKGANKIVKRDRHRWELDPASSEDYDER